MHSKNWLTWAGLILLIAGVLVLGEFLLPYIGSALAPIPTAPALTDFYTATVQPTYTLIPSATPTLQAEPGSEKTETPASKVMATQVLPTATLTPIPTGEVPAQVIIEDIKLAAPVLAIGWIYTESGGQRVPVWDVPDGFAAGWHKTSAKLGVVGNTVLNGHNTNNGEVFRDLYKLDIGASISVVGESGQIFAYRITEKYILLEAGQPLSVRLKNAEYIQGMEDERITLVTCHPYGSLRNRLIIIALPKTTVTLESAPQVQ